MTLMTLTVIRRANKMGDKSVRKEDVMDYFGEFMDEERAEYWAERVEGGSYFDKMNKIRDMLVESGYSVPFRAGYRRSVK